MKPLEPAGNRSVVCALIAMLREACPCRRRYEDPYSDSASQTHSSNSGETVVRTSRQRRTVGHQRTKRVQDTHKHLAHNSQVKLLLFDQFRILRAFADRFARARWVANSLTFKLGRKEITCRLRDQTIKLLINQLRGRMLGALVDDQSFVTRQICISGGCTTKVAICRSLEFCNARHSFFSILFFRS
jgi:hypothetical protein